MQGSRVRAGGGGDRGRDGTVALCLLAIAAVALIARLVTLPQVFPASGTPRILFVDTYYHLRRVELILAGGHLIPPFDLYSTYPTGGDFFWPPLFDYLLAIGGWIAGLFVHGRAAIEWAGALVPPLLGAAIVFPVYALGRFLFGRVAGLVAAAAMAVMPFHAVYSCLGRPDHHGAETLLLALHFLLFLRVSSAFEGRRVRFRDLAAPLVGWGGARRVPWAGVAGCALTGCALLSVQIGAILLLGVIPLYVGVRFLAGVYRGREREPLLAAAFVTQLGAAALLIPLTMLWHGSRGHEFVYNQPSLFQPGLLLLFAFFPFFLRRVGRILHLTGVRGAWAAAVSAAAAGVVFVVLPLGLIEGLRHAVGDALGWVGREEVYLETVLETRKLFARGEGFTLVPLYRYTGLFFASALAGAALLPSWWRISRRRRRRGHLFLALWSACLVLLSVDQVRFVMYLSANLALLTGAAVAFPFRRAAAPPLAALLSAVLLVAGGLETHGMLAGMGPAVEAPAAEACRWLARGTPETSHYLDPDTLPEYGIVAPPGYGHHIVYLGRRPVASNPFFDLAGLRRITRFFLARGEGEAVRALRAARCRYVFFTPRCFTATRYAGLLGEEAGAPWKEATDEARRIELLSRTPGAGLYLLDGASSPRFRLGARILEMDGRYDRFRLVYESRETVEDGSEEIPFRGFGGAGIPEVKIFELVEGARLAGHAEPGAGVRLEVPVTTPSGRRFLFAREARAGADGAFEFRVPYSGRAEVTIGGAGGGGEGRRIGVSVPEGAVLEGGRVEVGG